MAALGSCGSAAVVNSMSVLATQPNWGIASGNGSVSNSGLRRQNAIGCGVVADIILHSLSLTLLTLRILRDRKLRVRTSHYVLACDVAPTSGFSPLSIGVDKFLPPSEEVGVCGRLHVSFFL